MRSALASWRPSGENATPVIVALCLRARVRAGATLGTPHCGAGEQSVQPSGVDGCGRLVSAAGKRRGKIFDRRLIGEQPGELIRLALPCPPQLVELSGYVGASRLIALWWSPCGDELMGSDGTLTATGSWRGWLCFCDHPLVRLFLEPYRLGDSDDEGEHRLLVDRHLGTLDVGLARDVEQLLATRSPTSPTLRQSVRNRESHNATQFDRFSCVVPDRSCG